MKKILIYLCLTWFSTGLFAQQKVDNESFNTMLSELLSHSVPEVTPSQLRVTDSV